MIEIISFIQLFPVEVLMFSNKLNLRVFPTAIGVFTFYKQTPF